jgi:hypothetical protein
VASATSTKPATATARPPIRSVSRPVTVRVRSEPTQADPAGQVTRSLLRRQLHKLITSDLDRFNPRTGSLREARIGSKLGRPDTIAPAEPGQRVEVGQHSLSRG